MKKTNTTIIIFPMPTYVHMCNKKIYTVIIINIMLLFVVVVTSEPFSYSIGRNF